jgi:hypothetical protein
VLHLSWQGCLLVPSGRMGTAPAPGCVGSVRTILARWLFRLPFLIFYHTLCGDRLHASWRWPARLKPAQASFETPPLPSRPAVHNARKGEAPQVQIRPAGGADCLGLHRSQASMRERRAAAATNRSLPTQATITTDKTRCPTPISERRDMAWLNPLAYGPLIAVASGHGEKGESSNRLPRLRLPHPPSAGTIATELPGCEPLCLGQTMGWFPRLPYLWAWAQPAGAWVHGWQNLAARSELAGCARCMMGDCS